MYVAALSYGKDSIAMLEVIHRLGLPLDRVVTVDEWATDTLQALLPEVVEFQHKADVKIYDRYGIAVEHVRSPHTFESLFYGMRLAVSAWMLGKLVSKNRTVPKGNWKV